MAIKIKQAGEKERNAQTMWNVFMALGVQILTGRETELISPQLFSHFFHGEMTPKSICLSRRRCHLPYIVFLLNSES